MDSENKILRYNWYETNLAKFLTKYSLPIEYEGDFLKFLRKTHKKFLGDFKSILINGGIKGYPDQVYIKFDEAYNFINKLFRNIIATVSSWEAGEILRTENLIETIFDDLDTDFYTTNIDQDWFNHDFFRVRVPHGDENYKNRPLELFHIPYKKRYLARNDRYNMAGRINLYLSTCLNLAWRECNMPEKFYYAKLISNYDIIKNWKFLCFLSPQSICTKYLVAPIFNNPEIVSDFIARYLKTLPLIIACSLINRHGDVPYKPEYVIPQLVMQWINLHPDKIRGVLYFPCTLQKSMRSWSGYNIAIPVINFNKRGYGADLIDAFKIENPVLDDNRITPKEHQQIENCFNRISNFNYGHSKIADWYVAIYRNIVHIRELVNSSSKIPSSTLLSYVELLLESLDCFKKRYNNIEIFLKECQDDQLYQQRYETDYEEFHQIYDDFMAISGLIEKYYRHIERGIVTN